jgi:hypothetical protein
MSAVIVTGNVGAAAAAAARAARMREEEEKLTTYNTNELEGWEFKIVRANTGYFKKYERVKQVCEEEAKAGWEMVEKFDNYRIRFKRPIEKRKNDQYLQGIDPYRTQAGIGTGPLVATILGIIAAGIAVALIVTAIASKSH